MRSKDAMTRGRGVRRLALALFAAAVAVLASASAAHPDGWDDPWDDPPPPPPPRVSIDSGPEGVIRAPAATFTFSADGAGVDAQFKCSVDGGQFSANRWFDCRSPYTTLELENTTYTFRVQARIWHPEATYIPSEYSTPVARTFSVRGTFGSRFASFVVVGGKSLRSARRNGIEVEAALHCYSPCELVGRATLARKQARALGLRRRIGAGRITWWRQDPAWTAPAVEPPPESTRLTIRLTRRARARLAKVRRATVKLALESRVGKGTTRLKLRR